MKDGFILAQKLKSVYGSEPGAVATGSRGRDFIEVFAIAESFAGTGHPVATASGSDP